MSVEALSPVQRAHRANLTFNDESVFFLSSDESDDDPIDIPSLPVKIENEPSKIPQVKRKDFPSPKHTEPPRFKIDNNNLITPNVIFDVSPVAITPVPQVPQPSAAAPDPTYTRPDISNITPRSKAKLINHDEVKLPKPQEQEFPMKKLSIIIPRAKSTPIPTEIPSPTPKDDDGIILPDPNFVPDLHYSSDDEYIPPRQKNNDHFDFDNLIMKNDLTSTNPEISQSKENRRLLNIDMEQTLTKNQFQPVKMDELLQLPPEISTPSKTVLHAQFHEAQVNYRLRRQYWKGKIMEEREKAKARAEALIATHQREMKEFQKKYGLIQTNTMDCSRAQRIEGLNADGNLIKIKTIGSPKPGKRLLNMESNKSPQAAGERKKLIDKQTAEILALNQEDNDTMKRLEEKRDLDLAQHKENIRLLMDELDSSGYVPTGISNQDSMDLQFQKSNKNIEAGSIVQLSTLKNPPFV